MVMRTLALFAPLIVMLLLAAIIDLRQRRIPNWLTAVLALTGLMQAWTAFATVTPLHAVLGLLVGGALTTALFVIGALGGGDVKLLAGTGAWLGPTGVFLVFIAEAVLGLAMVLIQAAHEGKLRLLFRNSAVVAINLVHIRQLGTEHVAETGASCRSISKPLPYAVPVLAAVLLLIFGRGIL